MTYTREIKIKETIVHIAMIIFGLIAVVPVWVMLINATRNNAEINSGLSLIPSTHALDNWRILTSRNFQIWQGFGNSFFVSACVTILCVYFSSLVAYAIHIYRFRGRKLLWNLIMMLIMLPASLSFIGFCQFISKIHLMNSFIPLIIPSIASAGTVLFMKQYLESILSFELIEASRIDGAGEFLIFNQIILPVIKPAIATQAICSLAQKNIRFLCSFRCFAVTFTAQSTAESILESQFPSFRLSSSMPLCLATSSAV